MYDCCYVQKAKVELAFKEFAAFFQFSFADDVNYIYMYM